LVTGVTGGGVGLGILEALMKAGYDVYATDITPYSAGLLKARKGFVVPWASEPNYVNVIQAICKRNRIRIIVPGSEAELFELSKNSARLEREGFVVIANDHSLIAKCRDKWKMFRMFKENGIPCPDSALPRNYQEFKKKHGFPILLKQRTGSGSRNLYVIRNDSDYAFCRRRFNEMQIPFFLQEYLKESSEEYTVGVVCRKDGSIVGSITVHRLLEGLSSQQKMKFRNTVIEISTGISQGIIEDNREIQQQCEGYAIKLGVTGPGNFQGRLANGVFSIFELNPRFSGTTPFRVGVGFNDVDLVIRDRLNQPIEKPKFRTGVVVLRSLENVFVPLEEIEGIERVSQGA